MQIVYPDGRPLRHRAPPAIKVTDRRRGRSRPASGQEAVYDGTADDGEPVRVLRTTERRPADAACRDRRPLDELRSDTLTTLAWSAGRSSPALGVLGAGAAGLLVSPGRAAPGRPADRGRRAHRPHRGPRHPHPGRGRRRDRPAVRLLQLDDRRAGRLPRPAAAARSPTPGTSCAPRSPRLRTNIDLLLRSEETGRSLARRTEGAAAGQRQGADDRAGRADRRPAGAVRGRRRPRAGTLEVVALHEVVAAAVRPGPAARPRASVTPSWRPGTSRRAPPRWSGRWSTSWTTR